MMPGMPPNLPIQSKLSFGRVSKLSIPGFEPYYSTPLGDAYLVDSLALMNALPGDSIDVVLTSPPYALHFKKEYGNAEKASYVEWFLPLRARDLPRAQARRQLHPEHWRQLQQGGTDPLALPLQAPCRASSSRSASTWRRSASGTTRPRCRCRLSGSPFGDIRLRDSVEYVWWLSKTPWPKANNRKVLKPYSKDMERLNQRGIRATVRPSGHNIKSSFSGVDAGGSIPPNIHEDEDFPVEMLRVGNNAANDTYTKKCKEFDLKIHPRGSQRPCPSSTLNC